VLDEALSHSPSCVFLSFGDARPFGEQIRRSGAKLICQVQSLKHVDEALEAGATAVVAQGTEAGGHGATRSTLPFVPEVADYLARRSPTTLLLAAGGIADGRGLAAALVLGADGVLVGSRFWASEEALTPRAATDRAALATGDDTVRTKAIDALRGVPWPDEFSFRILKNRLTEQWAHREAEAAAAFGSLAREYADARSREDLDTVATVAGESVGLIHDRPSAGNIVEAIVTQARALLERGARLDFETSP
jgi:nitronate monooxygenase